MSISQIAIYKRNKHGNINIQNKELYLRNEIPCRVLLCPRCGARSVELAAQQKVGYSRGSSSVFICIIDETVALQQIAFLESSLVTDIIIPQSTIERIQTIDAFIYHRLNQCLDQEEKRFALFFDKFSAQIQGEQIDFRNKMIKIANWYADHIPEPLNVKFILLSEDDQRYNIFKDKCHIPIISVQQFALQRLIPQHPEIIDLIYKHVNETDQYLKRELLYAPHLSNEVQKQQLQQRIIVQGVLRMSIYNQYEGLVMARTQPVPIIIHGLDNLNRSLDGDLVAVQLFKRGDGFKRWGRPSQRIARRGYEIVDQDEEQEGDDNNYENIDELQSQDQTDNENDIELELGELIQFQQISQYNSSLSQDIQSSQQNIDNKQSQHQNDVDFIIDKQILGEVGSNSEMKQINNNIIINFEDNQIKNNKLIKDKESTSSKRLKLYPFGRIVGTIRRITKIYSGTLDIPNFIDQSLQPQVFLLRPVNMKIPMIAVSCSFPEKLRNKRLAVMIDGWNIDSKYPHGHIVRIWGEVGEIEAENEVILSEHDVPHDEFTQAQLDCVPNSDGLEEYKSRIHGNEQKKDSIGDVYLKEGSVAMMKDIENDDKTEIIQENQNIIMQQETENLHSNTQSSQFSYSIKPSFQFSEEEIGNSRWDLTDRPICSIDPNGCKDIDDAIHACIISRSNTPSFYSLNTLNYIQKSLALLFIISPHNLTSDLIDNSTAFQFSENEEAYLELGVHIADVAHFVMQGSELDKEAAHRSTTTYLVGKRYDMLPKRLTEELCSLRACEFHCAFSVLWKVSLQTGQIIAARYNKSIIHSQASLTYAAAQTLINEADQHITQIHLPSTQLIEKQSGFKSQLEYKPSSINDVQGKPIQTPSQSLLASLVLCRDFARQLKLLRFEQGALSLSSPALRFEHDDETHDPISVREYEYIETNSTVEEFMLLANIWVARRIYDFFPSFALLRRHPPPQQQGFDWLNQACIAAGVALDPSSNKTLNNSLQNAEKVQLAKQSPFFTTQLKMFATRAMSLALYCSAGDFEFPDFYHYGLAADVYTHFTSPIRRYSDLVVHRLLAATLAPSGQNYISQTNSSSQQTLSNPFLLEREEGEEISYDQQSVARICTNLNHRYKNAKDAGRDSAIQNTLKFIYLEGIKQDQLIIEPAFVNRVYRNGVVIFIPRFAFETFIIMDDSLLFQSPNTIKQRNQKSTEQQIISRNIHLYKVLSFNGPSQSIQFNEVQENEQQFQIFKHNLKLFDSIKVKVNVSKEPYGFEMLTQFFFE